MSEVSSDLDFIRIGREAFMACLMIRLCRNGKTKDAVVVPMEAAGTISGSWSSFWEAEKR